MKILHINFSDQGGGAEEFAFSLTQSQPNAKLLVSSKHSSSEKVLEFPKGSRFKFFVFLNKAFWKLGIKISFRSFFGFQNSYHGTYRFLQKLKEYKEADIIHLHNIHGEYFDLKSLRKIGGDKPIVWTSHDLWIATGGEGGIPAGASDQLRKTTYPLQGGLVDSRRKELNIKQRILYQLPQLLVVSPSRAHAKNIKAVHSSAEVRVIQYGIDTDIFNALKKESSVKTRIIILNSTSVFKNSTQVISALKKVTRAFELHVIGDKLVDSSLNFIINHGFIRDRFKLAALLKKMDMGVFSSSAETFGLLPAEVAASGGKVFLNKDIPVFAEHKELYNATLFENENHLKGLIEKALVNIDKTNREGFISAEMVKQKINRQRTFKLYEQLYQSLLSD